MNVRDYDKIILVGCGGSGKSWMAKHLAELTGYPLYHLDKELWQPGWVMPPREEKIAKQQEMMKGEQWIIEGNYNSTMELRYASADLIIFLDINRIICILSAAKRTGKKRSDLPDYLEEPKAFSKDFFQFCKWIWTYPKTGKITVMSLHEKYPDKTFLHIKTRRKVKILLKEWGMTAKC